MADIPNGWEVVKPVAPGWEVVGKSEMPEDVLPNTLGITAGGLAKGLNDGLNPLKLLQGIAALGGLMTGTSVIDRARASVPDMPVDPVADLLERGSKYTQPLDAAVALAKNFGLDLSGVSRTGEDYAKSVGAEMTPTRRVLAKTGEVIGQSAPLIAAGPAIGLGGIGSQLGAAAISGVGAGLGREVAGQPGEIIGSLLPLAPAGLAAATRGLVRGADPTAMRETIADFAKAGTVPSMGQATGSKVLSGMESTVGRFGSVGLMQRFAEKQAADFGAKVEGTAASIAPKTEEALVGRLVERGLTGLGGWTDRSTDVANKLYARVDALVQPDTPIVAANTLNYLTTRTANPLGSNLVAATNAESIKAIKPILDGLLTDMQKWRGQIPYEAMKQARSQVGEKFTDMILQGQITAKEAKALYASMSKDIEDGLKAIPGAFEANRAATNFWAARADHIESIVQPLMNRGVPEAIAQALDKGSREGSTMIKGTMSSLRPDEQNIVSAMVMRNLGSANPGAQNAVGDVFSPLVFLTRYNKLDDGAKRVLFASNKPLQESLDAFARTADAIKKGSRVLANPSNTAAAAFNLQQWFGLGSASVISGMLVGNAAAAGSAVGSLAVANGIGRLLVNPKAVNWLARSTTVSPAVWAQQGERLIQESNDPEAKAAIKAILNPK